MNAHSHTTVPFVGGRMSVVEDQFCIGVVSSSAANPMAASVFPFRVRKT